SGLKDIDSLTGGWQKNDLIILAARPSMGKTAASLHFAKSCLKNGGTVLVFSLEMSGTQNIKRLLSSSSHIEYSRMAKGEINN
ncbi:replicative DNA helicase, partial [Loigolactobacillus coryniformis]|uniref:DnaB-like helicase C-terminal domain-containing protein n=1 Tax=Loigolactobacillus coryniformis TaxID=1610 RepID=UPI0024BEE061